MSNYDSDFVTTFILHFANDVISDPLFGQRISDAIEREVESMVRTKLRTSQIYDIDCVDWKRVGMEIEVLDPTNSTDIARKMTGPITKEIIKRHYQTGLFMDQKILESENKHTKRKMIYLAE